MWAVCCVRVLVALGVHGLDRDHGVRRVGPATGPATYPTANLTQSQN